MSQYVFGLVLYGIPDPWSQDSSSVVVYTDGELPTSGLPSELSGCTVRAIVAKRPGVNWGADPRNPVGSGSQLTVTLTDDAEGTLGTLFLQDPDALFWGLSTNRLDDGDTAATLEGLPLIADASRIYFIGNEACSLSLGASTSQTRAVTLTRALCGSTVRTHFLRPSRYSVGEDGSQDRIFLSQKPSWEEGFYCGLYLFKLDQFGAISDYVLRRGVVDGEPEPQERPFYDVKVKLLEDRLSEHKIGETSKETVLTQPIVVTELTGVRPKTVQFRLPLRDAEAFFNEPLAPRGSQLLSTSLVSSLETRLKADSYIRYEIKVDDSDEWVFKITALSVVTEQTGATIQTVKKFVKVTASISAQGYTSGTSIVLNGAGEQYNGAVNSNTSSYLSYRPWWKGSGSAINAGGTDGTPPKITLRLVLQKTVTKAFLLLACSIDGSSGDTYDKIIGGVGAGLPQSFFNVGAAHGGNLPAAVAGNTSIMLELDQLLNPVNTYYFDLSKGISLRDFLTNEFIASQLLLCALQNGKLTLRSWVHEVAATITLNPLARPVKQGKRLSAVKRLDLSAGIRVLDLEPTARRQVRFLGVSQIKAEEVQPIRFWRNGLNLSVTDIQSGDLAQLVRAFYKIFGGAPRVYPVEIAMDDYLADGLEVGDAVNWSDADVVTPSGLGISGQFFVIGVDLDFDQGIANVLLLQNALYTVPAPQSTGYVAPALHVSAVTVVSSTVVKVKVLPVGATSFTPATDFGGIYQSIKDNAGLVQIKTHDQAPVGELEKPGSVEAHATITAITTNADHSIDLTLTIASAYLRGDYTTAASLLVAGEAKLLLPPRSAADSNLSAALIEPDAISHPASQNFATFQPQQPIIGVVHTFLAGTP